MCLYYLIKHVWIYIYIVINRQICFVLSEHLREARQARFPKLGSKPGWLECQSKILPLTHEETSTSEGNLTGYVSQLFLFTYIHLINIYIYIYIYKSWSKVLQYFGNECNEPC